VNYAETQKPIETPEKTKHTVAKRVSKKQPVIKPEIIETVEAENLATNTEIEPVLNEPTMVEIPEMNPNYELETVNTTKTFHSVPEYAEDLMAQKLNIADSEKDEMAMILARRITSKASEVLNAEYTKEATGDSGDESLTYTLRIGSFKVQRIKSR